MPLRILFHRTGWNAKTALDDEQIMKPSAAIPYAKVRQQQQQQPKVSNVLLTFI
jgi:hypothetical protein